MNINKVILGGRLARDPELKFGASGTAVCRICIATSKRWKTESGEQKEKMAFTNVVAFKKTAETIAKFFKKGSRIFIEGELDLNQWEDATTHQKRSALQVILNSFEFVDKKAEEPQGAQPAAATADDDNDPAF